MCMGPEIAAAIAAMAPEAGAAGASALPELTGGLASAGLLGDSSALAMLPAMGGATDIAGSAALDSLGGGGLGGLLSGMHAPKLTDALMANNLLSGQQPQRSAGGGLMQRPQVNAQYAPSVYAGKQDPKRHQFKLADYFGG